MTKTVKIAIICKHCSINIRFIKLRIKHFFVRLSLRFFRGLIVIKRHGAPIVSAFFQPFKTVGFVFLKLVGVPLYRGVYFLRKFIDTILLPAKNKFSYVLFNRYSLHIFITLLVVIVGITNFQARNVRAETFGQKSILYALVVTDDSQTVETVEAGKDVLLSGGATSYMSDAVSSSMAYMDTDNGLIQAPEITPPPAPTPTRTSVETYTVANGDTLGRIAVKFHLSISTILSANGLTLRSTLQPGDTIKILPSDGILYTVARGDTLSKIASNYSVAVDDIAQANDMSDGQSLKVGTEILLPGANEIAPSQAIARRPVSVKDIFVLPPKPVATEESPSSESPSSTRSDYYPPSSLSYSESPSATATGWVWPTNFHVITQYFSWSHTGLDIDGDYTTFSMAAHDGVVTYTGWRNGYGLTVEVDHGNGIKTRYAHNSKIFVNVGDIVTAGEKLAQTGTTGNSTGTHLHFEVIKDGKFQNPLEYIR